MKKIKSFTGKGIAKNTARLIPVQVNLERFKLLPYPKDDIIRFLFIGRIMKEKALNSFRCCKSY